MRIYWSLKSHRKAHEDAVHAAMPCSVLSATFPSSLTLPFIAYLDGILRCRVEALPLVASRVCNFDKWNIAAYV